MGYHSSAQPTGGSQEALGIYLQEPMLISLSHLGLGLDLTLNPFGKGYLFVLICFSSLCLGAGD